MDHFIIVMITACTVIAGGVAFAATGRDLRGGRRVAVSVACALLVGACCLFIPYLPVLALLVAAAAYLVLRRRLSAGLALAASGVLLVGGCTFSVLLMMAALETM